jgi:hypothetical protein
MSDELTYATFAALQGEAFQVQVAPDDTVAVTLGSATLHGTGANQAVPSRQGERFSLEFLGPRSRFLPQATYRFMHPRLGSFPVFIVPIGAEQDAFRYEAIFNRQTWSVASTA